MRRVFRKIGLRLAPRWTMYSWLDQRLNTPYMTNLAHQIMTLWAYGDSPEQIAREVGYTVKTVEGIIEYHKNLYLDHT